jgi:hypothetical protein
MERVGERSHVGAVPLGTRKPNVCNSNHRATGPAPKAPVSISVINELAPVSAG